MSATTPSAPAQPCDVSPSLDDRPGGDDLGDWFSPLRPRHDLDAEHALAHFERRVFARERPVTLARHVLQRRLGAGAHGVVYEGYDPDLDRKVAIKVLSRPGAITRQPQLLAEARALARLVHPNVVGVFDVGVEREVEMRCVFLVMELVQGTTLAAWSQQPHPWRLTLRRLIQAGRGLHAAHRAGLVHRDFKPSNVLIGEQGEVKVADFGLATHQSASDEGSTTATAGTPLYMAPELRGPAAASPASDQYAFCVAAWEALIGPLPDPGPDAATLRSSRKRRVPRALVRALRRGLHDDPARRWPSMSALLDQLGAVLGRRARVAALAAVTLTLLVAAAVLATAGAARPCSEALGRPTPLWSARAHDRTTAAWQGAAPLRREMLAQALARLSAHARAWEHASDQLCARADTKTPSPGQLRAMACLRRSRDAVTNAAASLRAPGKIDPVDAVAELVPPSSCLDPDAHAGRVIAPPGIRGEVSQLRRELAQAEASRRNGQRAASVTRARAVAEQAQRLRYPRLRHEAQLQLALAAHEPAQALHAVARDAIAAGDDDLAVRAMLAQAAAVAKDANTTSPALRRVELAEALARRSGHHATMEHEIVERRMHVLLRARRFDAAVQAYETLGHRRPFGDYRLHAAVALGYAGLGRWGPAHAAAQTAMARVRRGLGPDHLQTLEVQLALASVRRHGAPSQALALIADARRRLEATPGRESGAWADAPLVPTIDDLEAGTRQAIEARAVRPEAGGGEEDPPMAARVSGPVRWLRWLGVLP